MPGPRPCRRRPRRRRRRPRRLRVRPGDGRPHPRRHRARRRRQPGTVTGPAMMGGSTERAPPADDAQERRGRR
ncbi:hypothetical protein DQ238_01240 [Geodermatophilus sp. TF02-6]|nr:hypothetical protein DQ238_01240 [Geodermatophilus sp. TF02-6]